MQGQMSRTWAGGLAVLGLGILLLAPSQAQPPAPPPPLEKLSKDQQIEALKRAIQVLEEQKKAEQAGRDKAKEADTEKNRAEIEKAKAELAELGKQLHAKHDELQQVEAKYRAAMEHLAKLQGSGVFDAGGLRFWLHAGDPNSPVPARATIRMLPEPGAPPAGVIRSVEVHPGNLEQRLDRLQKEIEDLRRELKGGKRGAVNDLLLPPGSLQLQGEGGIRFTVPVAPATPGTPIPLILPVTPATPNR